MFIIYLITGYITKKNNPIKKYKKMSRVSRSAALRRFLVIGGSGNLGMSELYNIRKGFGGDVGLKGRIRVQHRHES